MRFLTMFEMTVYLECRGREGEGREGGFAAFPSSFTQKASVILSAARDLFKLSRLLIVGLNEVFLQMCFLFLLLSSN